MDFGSWISDQAVLITSSESANQPVANNSDLITGVANLLQSIALQIIDI